MATRDLTKSFLDYRSAAVRKRQTSSGSYRPSDSTNSYKKLAAGGGFDLQLAEEGIQLSELQNSNPPWVKDVEGVEHCLENITSACQELESMHAQRVGSVFGRSNDQLESQIESQTAKITDSFRKAERLLTRVGMATRNMGGHEATVGANVQRSLAKRLQEQSVQFRQSQRKYLKDVQVQKSGGLLSSDSKFGIDFENETSDHFFANPQSDTVDDMTMAVQSRDHEIVKIAQSIEELGSIFKELAVLVIDQGTILDRIDYNMEMVVDQTKIGVNQLQKAEKRQKNARPLRCMVCLSFTIFILMTILVLKHRPRRGWL